MPRLAGSSHGDTRLRILRVVRRGDRHDPRDLIVSVSFEGQFAPAFVEGRTDGIIPPETIKSFVRETAKACGDGEIETLGLALCDRVLTADPRITLARAELTEQPWARIALGGKAQGQTFTAGGPEQRTAVVTSNGARAAVVSGIQQLVLMRTSGFLRRGSTHRADDGSEDAVAALLAGTLAARWSYDTPEVAFGPYRQGVRGAILDTFALHASRSVQYTLHAIAQVVLDTYPEILDVTVGLQERRFDPAELFRPNSDEPDDLFVPSDSPVRTVEVTLARDEPSS